MRVGIDSRDLFASEPRGVGKTLATLIRYLMPLLAGGELNLYTNRVREYHYPANVKLRKIDMRGDRFQLWERVRLPVAAFTDHLDLLHCPSQTAPGFVSCPLILTVHDLIPLRIGDGWSEREVSVFRNSLARSVKRANRIIAVSEFTKKDLLSIFPLREDKVDVVTWGIDSNDLGSLDEEAWTALCQGHGIRPFFFWDLVDRRQEKMCYVF